MTEPRYRLSVWRWISTVEGPRLTETSYPVQPQTFGQLYATYRRWIRQAITDRSIEVVQRFDGDHMVEWNRAEVEANQARHDFYAPPVDWQQRAPRLEPQELAPEEQA